MSLWETFTLAVKNISGSKMRTFLTMLGIIIGVCAVIVIVGLGNGMAGYMEDSFAEMGTNTLTVSIMGRGTSRTVSEEQMYQIVEDNAGYLDQISPTVSMTGSVKIGSTTYSSTSVSGVGETWFDMKGYEVAQGRGIEYMDIVNRKKVCVVGSYVAQTCFGGNAVGQSLKVGGTTFSIVGVMAQEAEQMEEGGTDDCVYVPYSTAARLSFTGTISSYTVTVTDEEYAALGKEAIETALYKIFQDEDAYTVVSMAEMLDTMTSIDNLNNFHLFFAILLRLICFPPRFNCNTFMCSERVYGNFCGQKTAWSWPVSCGNARSTPPLFTLRIIPVSRWTASLSPH